MSYPRTALQSEQRVTQPGLSLPIIEEVKAFTLCFIYYANDHAPTESTPWERSDAAAAASEIVTKMYKVDARPEKMIRYYEKAKANAVKSCVLDWNEQTVARFLVGQIKAENTVKAIATFNLDRNLVSFEFRMLLIISANRLLKVAGLSGETVRVLKHVQDLSRKNPVNGVWTAWSSFTKDPHRGGVYIVDPLLLAITADHESCQFSSSNQAAAAADCTQKESRRHALRVCMSFAWGNQGCAVM